MYYMEKKCVVLQELYHLEISLSYHIGNVKKQMPIESISKKQKIVSKCRLLMLHDSCTIGDYDLNTEGMAWLCLSYFLISDGFLDFLRQVTQPDPIYFCYVLICRGSSFDNCLFSNQKTEKEKEILKRMLSSINF